MEIKPLQRKDFGKIQRFAITGMHLSQYTALMLDLRTDFSLPCKLIAEEHFLYDSIFTRI
ncbi:hypothetical protein [Weissella confusa]|uniref:hypothetical protein n=1 Tax=Weissella confusa TaxID=1583 RepID=UPI0018F27303|nr:hypothetical protein [Weissella confusa]MBJ7693488.1 hypothetical protein [Weissella confusa]